MSRIGKILSYEEMLEKFPDWILWETDSYYQESTPEATEANRVFRIKEIGSVVKFIQDHGLTRHVLCTTAPDIPDNFFVYLRDITPEGLDFYRTGYKKWLDHINRNTNADPSDVRIMEKALAEMRAKVAMAKKPLPSPVKRSKLSASESVEADEFIPLVKYDDASWHSEGDFPSDIPPDAAGTHIGMFFSWLVLNNMTSNDYKGAFGTNIDELRQRNFTPGAYFLRFCDGKFVSDDINAVGNKFSAFYYDMKQGAYIADYESSVAAGLSSTYLVPDTWETYDKLAPVIEERFQEWSKCQG
ncbi:hypothetical protein [Amphibiibacter pelophylacis]|uniref:Uncharacterized protein n=1 Tax=Amphibiibacter pelophylacis TaxID=1799477 RepID=A0ACC6P4K3_9BURK